MDAIILVGGQGTRLRPLTARRHKSLFPIGDKRAFDFLLDWAREYGIERAVLALGQNNEDLPAAYADGNHNGLPITVVTETEPLQSGGAIKFAAEQANVEGRFLALNGDIFHELALDEMVRRHEESGAELSISLHEEEDARQYGVAQLDGEGLITHFVEKSPNPPSRLVNAGAWIFEPHLVDEIPGPVRVEETLFPQMVDAGRRVRGHRFHGLWADIGTPERYYELVMKLVERGLNVSVAGLSIGRGASLVGSTAGPGCRLGAGAEVESSILWEDVDVGPDARIRASVIADNVTIGAGAVLEDCVVGPGATVAAGASVPAGTVIEADGMFGGSDGGIDD